MAKVMAVVVVVVVLAARDPFTQQTDRYWWPTRWW